jgi:hypothetical protein
MLVAWGQFAHCIGLIQGLEAVPLHQKTRVHRPQTKVLEFMVAILAGLPHLKDLSRSAHPLDQDIAVAHAWGQPAWADYSGVSRSLAALTQEEGVRLTQVLERISQPLVDQEVMLALRDRDELVYDGDLTGRPVSNTSTTYPNVAYGHMSDAIRLGYKAAMVSLHSPSYGRLWLSSVQHSGEVVSANQAEALVTAAEAKTGLRPRRRTEWLQVRLQALEPRRQALEAKVQKRQQQLALAEAQEAETGQQVARWQVEVARLAAEYARRQRPERPHSFLAKARIKLGVQQRRQARREQQVTQAQKRLAHQQACLEACQKEDGLLQQRLSQYEAENATNPFPIRAVFRLDAGFGSRDNVALLIELGYEVYLKPYSSWLTPRLKKRVSSQTTWARVGENAEMVAWADLQPEDFPYPIDVALERFHTGKSQRYGALIHFGNDRVTTDLPGWFHQYNGRQTIEAGIKEGKQVFEMHHLKVRSPAALYLQEQLAVFAANFVRWAAHWLVHQCPQVPDGWQDTLEPSRVKKQVKVAAHTSAWVSWDEQGCLLRFTKHSVFAGRSLRVKRQWAYQMVLPFAKSCFFSTFKVV